MTISMKVHLTAKLAMRPKTHCGSICAMPTSKRRKSRKPKPEANNLDLRGLRFTALGLMVLKQIRDEDEKADPKGGAS